MIARGDKGSSNGTWIRSLFGFAQTTWLVCSGACNDEIGASFEPFRVFFGNSKFHFIQKEGIINPINSLAHCELVNKNYLLRIRKYHGHYLFSRKKRLSLFGQKITITPPLQRLSTLRKPRKQITGWCWQDKMWCTRLVDADSFDILPHLHSSSITYHNIMIFFQPFLEYYYILVVQDVFHLQDSYHQS